MAEIVKLRPNSEPKNVILFQCLSRETGEYCDEYAVELEFDSRASAVAWLKKKKIPGYKELALNDSMF